jgi:hypothetical protein
MSHAGGYEIASVALTIGDDEGTGNRHDGHYED